MAEEAIAQKKHYKALQTMSLPKVATATDCAYAIVHLSSQVTSGHTSGTILTVDGGMDGRVINSLEDLQRSSKL